MDDLIKRADAIEAVCRDCTIETKNNCKEEGYCYEVQNLMALPSAEAVNGEWVEREDWNGDYYYDCSVCGESFVLCDGTPSMNLYHFCPNCGADMRADK